MKKRIYKWAYGLPRRILATTCPFYVQISFKITQKNSNNDLKIESFGVVVGWYQEFLKIGAPQTGSQVGLTLHLGGGDSVFKFHF